MTRAGARGTDTSDRCAAADAYGLDGPYNVLPARAEQMYFSEVFGRSDGEQFVIEK